MPYFLKHSEFINSSAKRAEENTNNANEAPIFIIRQMDIAQRININKNDKRMSHFSDEYMPSRGAYKQTNIRPPSNPFMGNKLRRAKKKHATAKKIK